MSVRCKLWRVGLWVVIGLLLAPCAAPAIEPAPSAVAESPGAATVESTPTETTESVDDWRPASGDDIPPPRTHYKGRAIAETMSFLGSPWLTRPTREREEHAEEMLDALGLKPGQVVCDFGCGNGYHTLRLAERVGKMGRVLAVDVQPEMLRLLEQRLKEAHVENVELVPARPHDPALPAGEIDLILLVDVYHELSYPEHILRGLRRALKPTGRLVLVEFREEDPLVPIKPEHKMSKWQILRELLPNGYRLAEQYDKLPWQHLMQFERAENASSTDVDSSTPDQIPTSIEK